LNLALRGVHWFDGGVALHGSCNISHAAAAKALSLVCASSHTLQISDLVTTSTNMCQEWFSLHQMRGLLKVWED
jgi:hypothetical protein